MKVSVFTDGASRGNPGKGGWGAIVVYGEETKELGGFVDGVTNNQMELMAFINAIEFVKSKGFKEIDVYTDSSYLINGSSKWLSNWKRNGWKTKNKEDVLNKELWEKISDFIDELNISWIQVEGHAGVVGNERCDEIATSFADGKSTDLFDGNISSYEIPLFEKREKKLMYLSMVDGEIKVHDTWEECKERVEGKKGVKYKKVFSEEERRRVEEEWGK